MRNLFVLVAVLATGCTTAAPPFPRLIGSPELCGAAMPRDRSPCSGGR